MLSASLMYEMNISSPFLIAEMEKNIVWFKRISTNVVYVCQRLLPLTAHNWKKVPSSDPVEELDVNCALEFSAWFAMSMIGTIANQSG